jgi:predicted enzyme related to lactoylglutathione lyase
MALQDLDGSITAFEPQPKGSFQSCTNILLMFKSLDFLYVPAPDIESSVQFYTQVLGGELVWKIHAFGVWVACIALSKAGKPYVLLADHIGKNDVMLIYQVENLEDSIALLKSKGMKEEKKIEIPPGPCCTFRDPAGNALVIYENKRPNVMEEFKGKIDVASKPLGSPSQLP